MKASDLLVKMLFSDAHEHVTCAPCGVKGNTRASTLRLGRSGI